MNQWVWFGIAMIVFVTCVGGSVYNMINRVPWFKYGVKKNGDMFIAGYFMPGQNT